MTLLRNHREAIAAMDFFTVPALTFNLLYCFFIIGHPWMPRPPELLNTGKPVTTDFAYIRWLGDRKGIEERTMVWDKTIIDRTEELKEWAGLMRRLHDHGTYIYACSNNHYGGFAPDTVRMFRSLWEREQ